MSQQKPLFVPILDNGGGIIMARFTVALDFAFHDRNIVRPIPYFQGSHPDRGMNHVANAFLESGCDWWINIDADVIFSRSDIDCLLGHNPEHRLIYGIYPKKQPDTPPCLCTFAEMPQPDVDGLTTVRRAGRGFMLVHRSLLEAMKEENGGPAVRLHHPQFTGWNFFESGPVTGDFSAFGNQTDPEGRPLREWISEDWMFCERARALGVPTLVDTRIALGHEGGKVYRFGSDQVTRFDSDIKSWRDIHGWFDYPNFYRWLVHQLPSVSTFAEVGCWFGRSICAFDEFAKSAKKSIALHAVDTFRGNPGNSAHATILHAHGGYIGNVFRNNLQALNVAATVHESDSAKAADRFEPASLDAAFIDADHSYEAVKGDISAWLPKVKPGGIICGHDIDEAGVLAAVSELLPGYQTMDRCWWKRV